MKMPTFVGIFIFISRENFMLSWVEHEKKFYNLGAWSTYHTICHGKKCIMSLKLHIQCYFFFQNVMICFYGEIQKIPHLCNCEKGVLHSMGLCILQSNLSGWNSFGTIEICSRYLKFITKTCLYDVDPIKPHFYIIKFGFTGVYIIFLISAQKHRLWILVRTTSPRRF